MPLSAIASVGVPGFCHDARLCRHEISSVDATVQFAICINNALSGMRQQLDYAYDLRTDVFFKCRRRRVFFSINESEKNNGNKSQRNQSHANTRNMSTSLRPHSDVNVVRRCGPFGCMKYSNGTCEHNK